MAIEFLKADFKPFTILNDQDDEINNPIEDYYSGILPDIQEFSYWGKPEDFEDEDEDEDLYTFAQRVLFNLGNQPENIDETAAGNSSNVENKQVITQNEQTLKQEPHKSTKNSYTFSFLNNKDYKKSDFDRFNKAFDKVAKDNPSAARYRNLLTEIAYIESKFQPSIVNKKGAIGYFQFIPITRDDLRQRFNYTFTDSQLQNDPELQIRAALTLMKHLENELKLDTNAMSKIGMSMSGGLGAAWFMGVGSKSKRNGARGYIYYGNDPSDGHTKASTYIRKVNNIPLEYNTVNINNSKSQNFTNIGKFNVSKALDHLHYLTNFVLKTPDPKTWDKKSTTDVGHYCARAIRMAMEAGGLSTKGRPQYGGDYGDYLLKHGWERISSSQTQFQPGDICVSHGIGRVNKNGHHMGHISMYDGSRWVSDYVQSGWKQFKNAKEGTNTFFYRYKG